MVRVTVPGYVEPFCVWGCVDVGVSLVISLGVNKSLFVSPVKVHATKGVE